MHLVCLVGQDDVPVVHQSSPAADQRDCGVIGDQRHGAPAGANPVAPTSTDKGHVPVLVHPDVIDSVIVGGVGAHAAPTDWGRVAAQRPVEALRRGGARRSLGPHRRAAMVLVEGGQHGAGGGERCGKKSRGRRRPLSCV